MKIEKLAKITSMVLTSAVLVFCLTACGGQKQDMPANESEPETAVSEKEDVQEAAQASAEDAKETDKSTNAAESNAENNADANCILIRTTA